MLVVVAAAEGLAADSFFVSILSPLRAHHGSGEGDGGGGGGAQAGGGWQWLDGCSTFVC